MSFSTIYQSSLWYQSPNYHKIFFSFKHVNLTFLYAVFFFCFQLVFNPLLQLMVLNASQTPLKLTKTTYFGWKVHFDALLVGYDLFGVVDYTFLCPSTTVSGSFSVNANYVYWVWQDILLLISLLDFVSWCVSSSCCHQNFQRATVFAKTSRSWLIQLHELCFILQRLRSHLTYLHDIWSTVGEFSLFVMHIPDDELVIYVLNGLCNNLKENFSSLKNLWLSYVH